MKQKRDGQRERRRFPRLPTSVKVRLRALRGKEVVFDACLPARDFSLGGIFLESEFFLPTGTHLHAEFQLEEKGAAVEVEGVVVRQEKLDEQGGLRSGFALNFTEYLGDAKLVLARHFLIPRLGVFLDGYLASGRATRVRGERERLLDVLVAWELDRIEKGEYRLKL